MGTSCTSVQHGVYVLHYNPAILSLGEEQDLACICRSLVQGALAWIWAQCARAVPIPGFKN